MARTTTTYDLLLSCPGDVYEQCFSIVETAVTNFNKMYGQLFNVGINLTHWSTDSYPQSGGHPQQSINAQIVDPADAAVAIFWTRFGTPTEQYGSGTEEEIERMLSSGRQVFLYIFDKPVPPSLLADSKSRAEYDKIQALKNKYQSRGIYWQVRDEQDLKKELTLHLAKHFLSAIEKSTGRSVKVDKPQLIITGRNENRDVSVGLLNHSRTSKLVENRAAVITLIKVAMNNQLSPRSTKADEALKSARELADNPLMRLTGSFIGNKMPAGVSNDDKCLVEKLCSSEGIDITSDFWNFGDLNQNVVLYKSPFGDYPDDGLIGIDVEKERYRLIRKIIRNILEYNYYVKYFKEVDNIPFIELAIRNAGTTFDQEVDVKLIFPNGSLLPMDEFPLPGLLNEEFVKIQDIDAIICPKANSELIEFEDYPRGHFLHGSTEIPHFNETTKAQIERYISEYYQRIEDLYYYDIFQEGEKVVLKIKFNEVRQHTGILFPTRLFLLKVPDSIEYTITGKYTSDVTHGKLILKQTFL